MLVNRGDLLVPCIGEVYVALSEGYVDSYDRFTYIPVVDENLEFHNSFLRNSVVDKSPIYNSISLRKCSTSSKQRFNNSLSRMINKNDVETVALKHNASHRRSLSDSCDFYEIVCGLLDIKADFTYTDEFGNVVQSLYGFPLFTVKKRNLINILSEYVDSGSLPEVYWICNNKYTKQCLSLYKERCRPSDYQFGKVFYL